MYLFPNSKKKIKISFKFKSLQKHTFNQLVLKVQKKLTGMLLSNASFFNLPTKISRYTVLRSPHVDKKSREQFEKKLYQKTLITTFDFNLDIEKQKAKILINFIKNSSSGVDIRIKYYI